MIKLVKAGHVAGGEIYYVYVGKGVAPNSSIYRITLRLFRECNPTGSAAPLPDNVSIGIYTNEGSNSVPVPGSLFNVVRKGSVNQLNLTTYDPCLTNKIPVCYQVALYEFDTELPDIPSGYIIGYQTCCRSYSIVNVAFYQIPQNPTVIAEGSTFSCEIPGTNALGTDTSSSPKFYLKDTTLVCANSRFKLDFGAGDKDGDSLSYQLCSAYNRGGTSFAADNSFSNPPYQPVSYNSPYSGDFPLGPNADIDPKTGIISGIAPAIGSYVVNVCVNEWRKGKIISIHRKDFTLKVTSCKLQGASLKPQYLNCDSLKFHFFNESAASNIASYLWTFGDSIGGIPNTDTLPSPKHEYLDTGTYTVKLNVVAIGGCLDSTITKVKVYPGFRSDFKIAGSCITNPYSFSDSTYTRYGTVNNWKWDFGEPGIRTDTSSKKNPTYKYSSNGNKTVKLTVMNSNGCESIKTYSLFVKDNPVLKLPFHDTLICSIDTLQLNASVVNPTGFATFLWTSKDSIINPTSLNPFVNPKDTAYYYLLLSDSGCYARDTVKVNVLDGINVNVKPKDTSICEKDSIQLFSYTNGLQFNWSSNSSEVIKQTKNPIVHPSAFQTKYLVTANLGKCIAKNSLLIEVRPLPKVNAGLDETICFGYNVQLRSNIVGSIFKWSPTNTLSDSTTLFPVAFPDTSTLYTLTVIDTNKIGCPKPVTDTLIVRVIPKVKIYAGNDTAVVYNQPLQLVATGNVDTLSTRYNWTLLNGSYPTGMNNPNIYNPTIRFSIATDSIFLVVKATDKYNCFGNDTVKIVVFKSLPDIFVPSAFTPNNDLINDIVKAIPVGVLEFDYFKIYNRLGQLLFSTTQQSQGWDGTFKGIAQPSGTYVYVAQGKNYLGKPIQKKGTVVLIR